MILILETSLVTSCSAPRISLQSPTRRAQHLLMAEEKYTDFPLLGVALPGGILHSYYALATVPGIDKNGCNPSNTSAF